MLLLLTLVPQYPAVHKFVHFLLVPSYLPQRQESLCLEPVILTGERLRTVFFSLLTLQNSKQELFCVTHKKILEYFFV